MEERFCVELDTPPSLYSLSVGKAYRQDVGYVASRHCIHCFSSSAGTTLPNFAPFFPFDEDSISQFLATPHTEVLSLASFRLTHPYHGSSALAFVTYTPARDLPNNKSRRVLHFCADEVSPESTHFHSPVGSPEHASGFSGVPLWTHSRRGSKSTTDQSSQSEWDSTEEGTEEEDEEEEESFILPSIDQHIANLHSTYQSIDIEFTPYIIFSFYTAACSLLTPDEEKQYEHRMQSRGLSSPRDMPSSPRNLSSSKEGMETFLEEQENEAEGLGEEETDQLFRRGLRDTPSPLHSRRNFLRRASISLMPKKLINAAPLADSSLSSQSMPVGELVETTTAVPEPMEHNKPKVENQWKNISSPECLERVPFQILESNKESYKLPSQGQESQSEDSSEVASESTEGVDPQENSSNPVRLMLMIAGSDHKIHGYIENVSESNSNPFSADRSTIPFSPSRSVKSVFQPVLSLQEFLPELEDLQLQCCVIAMDIKYVAQYRCVALGCQDGSLYLVVSQLLPVENTHASTVKVKILLKCSTSLDGPISSVRFFLSSSSRTGLQDHPHVHAPSRPLHSLYREFTSASRVEKEQTQPAIHLLVTAPVGYTVLYESIITKRLFRARLLPDSDLYDSVTCCEVIHWDQSHFIVIGTYSGTVLFYHPSSPHTPSPEPYLIHSSHHLAVPVLGMRLAYLHYHGAPSLVVTSASGVHFLEFPTEFLGQMVRERLLYFAERRRLLQQLAALTNSPPHS